MTQRDGSNGFDRDQLQRYLDEIASADDDLLTLKSDYMLSCKPARKRIRETMKAAKTDGVNMAALREIIADDRAKRRRDRRIAELEADDLADYKAMAEALGEFGETPLGQAALARAKGGEALDSLQRADEAQLNQVGRG